MQALSSAWAPPMIAYVTVDGKTMLSGSRMTIIAGVFSVCAILCYLLCFKMVQERVQLTTKSEKLDLGKLVKSIATNRSLIGIIAAALMLLLSQLTMSGMSSYVYPNYYGQRCRTVSGKSGGHGRYPAHLRPHRRQALPEVR